MKRILIVTGAVVTTTLLALGGLFAAWLSGMHVPVASGATYLRVEKLNPVAAANQVIGEPNAPFFILLVGNDSRPGVGGARGDALHLLGVNPTKHQATILDIPRDTCWNGDKINVGNTRGPRGAGAGRRRAGRRARVLRDRRRLRGVHGPGRRRRRRRRERHDERCTTRTRVRTSRPVCTT